MIELIATVSEVMSEDEIVNQILEACEGYKNAKSNGTEQEVEKFKRDLLLSAQLVLVKQVTEKEGLSKTIEDMNTSKRMHDTMFGAKLEN